MTFDLTRVPLLSDVKIDHCQDAADRWDTEHDNPNFKILPLVAAEGASNRMALDTTRHEWQWICHHCRRYVRERGRRKEVIQHLKTRLVPVRRHLHPANSLVRHNIPSPMHDVDYSYYWRVKQRRRGCLVVDPSHNRQCKHCIGVPGQRLWRDTDLNRHLVDKLSSSIAHTK